MRVKILKILNIHDIISLFHIILVKEYFMPLLFLVIVIIIIVKIVNYHKEREYEELEVAVLRKLGFSSWNVIPYFATT